MIKKTDVGLYRHDGLIVVRNMQGRSTDNLRKNIIGIFKDIGLQIDIVTGLHSVDLLDVTLNLKTNSYQPFKKPNDSLLYVHTSSTHPPQILKQLPASIADRLSKNSSSGTIFNQSKPEYEEALKKSGYHNVNLQYAEHPEEEIEIAISSGLIRRTQKMFPRMLQRNFCPLFRSTSRVNTWESSSTRTTCTDNMRTIISRHNSKLSRPKKQPSSECNCRKKEDCPLNGTCKQSSVVYKCDVSAPNHPDKVYIGLTEKDFKTRWNSHKLSINNAK